MLLRATDNFHFPITVTKLLVGPSDQVARFDTLFKYTYRSKVTEGDKYGDEVEVEKEFPAEFKSELDGTLASWHIREGDILTRAGASLVTIDEPCTHEETFGNLCVNCGVDVTQLDNSLTTVPNEYRATVNTAHTNTALKVSARVANRNSEEATRRLLETRKLSLVVDLDQTIIHATVDPTIAEWQKDPRNPNYDAVKDVKAFQLMDDGPGMRGCWYYIKLRPGLEKFLSDIALTYELHIYTMGTRAYAQNIAKIVDPEQKIFGDRILSRDESGSMTAKNLGRLFPVNTDMVVIIDDRGDVWSWSPNLVKVSPYDFFVGIGDINSSFLPKAQGIIAKPKVEAPPTTNGNGVVPDNDETSTANSADAAEGVSNDVAPDIGSQLVAMAGSTDEAAISAQNQAQDVVIAAQLEDRPLMRKQEALDQMDEAEEANGDASETSSEHSQKHRHNLLRDDDDELLFLQQHLEHVHKAFFDDFDQRRKTLSANRVAELRGEKTSPKKPTPVDDLAIVPDVKTIMPSMKEQVLKGVVICFTGVIPQHVEHKRSDIGMWAQSFGARINTTLTRATTHVIAHKDRRTSKVRQATQHPEIQIVSVSWLLDCFSKWEHVDEGPHVIDFGRDKGQHDTLPFDGFEEGMTLTPSEDGGDVQELPEDPDEPLSPTFDSGKIYWDEVDDEVKDFLGSDDESEFDEDSESDASNASNASGSSRRKRKREEGSVDGSDHDGDDLPDSSLQKRKKRALERSTGLANVTVAEQPSGLPSPDTTGPDEAKPSKALEDAISENGGDIDDDDDDGWDQAFDEALNSDEEDLEAEPVAAASSV